MSHRQRLPFLLLLAFSFVAAAAWLLVDRQHLWQTPRVEEEVPHTGDGQAPVDADAPEAEGLPLATVPWSERQPAGVREMLPVSGIIVDGTGRAVAGATVTLAPSSLNAPLHLSEATDEEMLPEGTLQMRTHGDGRFAFEVEAAPRLHVVGAAHPEHAPVVVEHVSAGATDLVLRLDQGVILEGMVRDADGAPVSGARVTWHALLARGACVRTAPSDAGGRYRLAGLPDPSLDSPSYADLQVEHPDYAHSFVELDNMRWPNTEPGEPAVLRRDVVLARGARLAGRVEDAVTRQGVANVSVELWSRAQMSPYVDKNGGFWIPWRGGRMATTRADADGAFAFEQVAPGPWLVRVLVEGRAPAGAWVEVPKEPESGVTVTVRLVPGGGLRGRLADEDGQPLAGCRLQLGCRGWAALPRFGWGPVGLPPPEWVVWWRSEDRRPVELIADGTGAFQYDGIPVDPEERTTVEVSSWHPDGGRRQEVLCEVAAGEIVDLGDLVLLAPDESKLVLSGRVLDPAGQPVRGARVVLVNEDEVATDGEGRFAFRLTGAGGRLRERYDLVVSARGFAVHRAVLSRDAPRQELAVVLEPEAVLAGLVVDEEAVVPHGHRDGPGGQVHAVHPAEAVPLRAVPARHGPAVDAAGGARVRVDGDEAAADVQAALVLLQRVYRR